MLGTSKKEQELIEFCQQFYPNLIIKDRQLIKPYELDIVIPELHLALEFNGNYYHSIEAGTPLGYHLMKTELCENLGYRLIHVWENEWNEELKQKLIQVFEGNEVIHNEEMLDRSWYSLININKDVEILPPAIINRNGFQVENCGYFKITNK